MKIAFFTEAQFEGKIPRTHPNLRTDLAWQVALDATHLNFYSDVMENYDIGIFIIPKKCEDGNFDLNVWYDKFFSTKIKPKIKYVVFMQEGPNNGWQDLRIATQITYLNFLEECHAILCHNEIDRKYYQGLFPFKIVSVLPSLMITSNLTIPRENRTGTIVGGNMVSWYGGMDSYLIARNMELPIYIPSMGRKQKYEELLPDINHIEYKDWNNWMYELNKRKYAIHLMRTFAAGTFALNCAYLKIPCIGWNGCDTQVKLFPELTFEVSDMEGVHKKVHHLMTNDLFYNHVCEYAKKIYEDEYSEQKFIQKFNIFISKLIGETV